MFRFASRVVCALPRRQQQQQHQQLRAVQFVSSNLLRRRFVATQAPKEPKKDDVKPDEAKSDATGADSNADTTQPNQKRNFSAVFAIGAVGLMLISLFSVAMPNRRDGGNGDDAEEMHREASVFRKERDEHDRIRAVKRERRFRDKPETIEAKSIEQTFSSEIAETWREVPFYYPRKRFQAYYQERMNDPFFQSLSASEQMSTYFKDTIWGGLQPVVDASAEGSAALQEQAFLLPKQYQRGKLTVLIDYSTFLRFYYDPQLGVVCRKRPGTDVLLERLSQYCDLVLVCDRTRGEVEQFFWKIDPFSRFTVRLYKQALVLKHNRKWKPMHRLGRNMARVLLIDSRLAVSDDYIDNTIVLKPWGGVAPENTLDMLNLLPFILQLAKSNEDVRDHLRKFREDRIYIPLFYHRLRILMQMYDAKKANPVATSVIQLNPNPEFWDNSTLPAADEWDNEPDSMIKPPKNPGGSWIRSPLLPSLAPRPEEGSEDDIVRKKFPPGYVQYDNTYTDPGARGKAGKM